MAALELFGGQPIEFAQGAGKFGCQRTQFRSLFFAFARNVALTKYEHSLIFSQQGGAVSQHWRFFHSL